MWETRSVFHISMPRLFRQDGLRCRRHVAQRRVRPFRVVFHAPPLRQNLCLLQRVEISPFKNSSRSFPLKLSQYPFSHGLPGSMYNVLVPSFPSHFRNSSAIDRKSTRLNSSHLGISYAVFCLKKKNKHATTQALHR